MRLAALGPAVLLTIGCLDSTHLPLPDAPSGAQSAVWVRSCGDALSASLYRAGELPAAMAEACEEQLTYHLLYLSPSPEALRLGPGALELEPCPNQPQPCCAEAALPLRQVLSAHVARREEPGPPLSFSSLEALPSELMALRYRRECDCPSMRYQVIDVPRSLSYARLRVAGGQDGRVALSGLTGQVRGAGPRRADLYVTSVQTLRSGGFPTETSTSIPDRELSGLSWSTGGSLFAGESDRPWLHERRPGAEWKRRAVPTPSGGAALLSMQPGAGPGRRLAVANWLEPGRVEYLLDETWEVFDGTELLRGTCEQPEGYEEQSAALLWTGEDELAFMPRARSRAVRTVVSPATAPDGFFRLRGDAAEWVRVEREESSCLSGLVHSPTLGLVVSSHEGRFYRETPVGWEEISLARHPRAPADGVRADAMSAIPGGFAFGRSLGGFGLVHDDVLCVHEILGRTSIESMSWAGGTLVATGERDRIGGRLAIYLIDIETVERE